MCWNMAPEIMSGDKYKNNCDLYSIGVTVYYLYFKEYPFPFNEMTLYTLLPIKEKYEIEKLKEIQDKELEDLIRKLLIEDPKKRITWKEYFDHPFFKKYSD